MNSRYLFMLLLAMFIVSGRAIADEEMPCNLDGPCSDPCIYFASDIVFVVTDDGAQLKYNDKIHNLSKSSTRQVRRRQGFANLPGDIELQVYEGKDVRVELTSKVIKTSCYERNKKGIYESVDKCCSTDYRMTMKLQTGNTTKIVKTMWDAGC